MSTSSAITTSAVCFYANSQSHDFTSICESFCTTEEANSGFPLRGRLRMQSSIALGFPSRDFHIEIQKSGMPGDELPVMHIAFLTLAGAGGALPWWITEKIVLDPTLEGKAFHRFLDLLNRRFWELLFLKNRLGGNPRYGLSGSPHALLFRELCFAFVGMVDHATLLRVPSGVPLLNITMQHCWGAAMGGGGHKALSVLLTSACGCEVDVRGFQLVRLPVATQAKLILGGHGCLSRAKGVIGMKALVRAGVTLRVLLPNAELVDQYLPTENGSCWNLLRRILAIFYNQSLPPVVLRLEYLANTTFSSLGGGRCRLGWGAMVSSPAPCSQLVKMSTQIMSHKQYKHKDQVE